MTVITRKIEIYVNEPDKELRSAHYDKLFKWLQICRKAANLLATHYFTQDNIKDFFYLKEDLKLKLADIGKDETGMLKTSWGNTGYQLLSSLFKGEIPMEIMSNLNQDIHKNYKAERLKYFKGERSLRNYKRNIQVPFKTDRIILQKEERNYSFNLFNIPFKTTFGVDKSGNEVIVDRIAAGEYKWNMSKLQYDDRKKKWFMLMCLNIPNREAEVINGKQLFAHLHIETPILAGVDDRYLYKIGSKEEFLHNRIQIQAALSRLQKACRYNIPGKGRASKMQAIERFKKKESNYIATKLHQYSNTLVNLAAKYKCAEIVLVDQQQKEDIAKEDMFLLRNWGYKGLIDKITYKANRLGIEVKKVDIKEMQVYEN